MVRLMWPLLFLVLIVGRPVVNAEFPERLQRDKQRDATSKPHLILPLLNLQSGSSVVDVFAGGGYYSELLAREVGFEGRVLLYNTEGFRLWGINDLNTRFDRRSLPNIQQHTAPFTEPGLGEGSYDAAIMVLALHDLYVTPTQYDGERYVPTGEASGGQALLKHLHTALKPGSRFVVIDHVGDPDQPAREVLDLHRIHENFVIDEVVAAGFRFLESSGALRNPEDDHRAIVFDPHVKRKTDRFVLVFERPSFPL